jgi:hypothetical protein
LSVLGQYDNNGIAQLEEKTTENLAEATSLHTSYKENMRIASTVSSLFDITGSLRSSLSFLRALPYVDTASRRSTWRPGYWPQVAIATAVVARWRTDAGRALLYKGTRYSKKPRVDSACWGRAMKFLKKKGTASYSGGIVIVAGTSLLRFHTNDSKLNIWSSGSGVCIPWIKGMRCPSVLGSDGVRDLLMLATWNELGSDDISKLASGELLQLVTILNNLVALLRPN